MAGSEKKILSTPPKCERNVHDEPMSAIILDTLDDRREIWHLLHRLHPFDRVRFLAWCCRLVPEKQGRPIPSHRLRDRMRSAVRCDRSDMALTNEIYTDLWTLSHQYKIDMDHVASSLVACVREASRVNRTPAEFCFFVPDRPAVSAAETP